MPAAKKPPADDTEELVLDAASFTSPERMECQVRFDASFGDLLRCIFEAVDPRRDGPMETRIIDREGVQHFPDQILQFMVWVQAKRGDPDVELEDFDGLRFGELAGAHLRGLVGKDNGSAKSTRSSRGRSSAASSKG